MPLHIRNSNDTKARILNQKSHDAGEPILELLRYNPKSLNYLNITKQSEENDIN